MNRFIENFKNVDFVPQNTMFTPFWTKGKFSLNIQMVNFNHFLMPFALNDFQKI